jgi:predicted nucleic acid-binding Zn ribbon protein
MRMEKEEKRFTRSDIITFLAALGLLALIGWLFLVPSVG